MADYFMPTVIEPLIPVADITPLERLILGQMFEIELDGEALYLFSEIGPSECFFLSRTELREAMTQSAGAASVLADYLTPTLANADDDDAHVDLTGLSWEFILQDIVKRSPAIDHIIVTASFTCSRMRSDGFGGMAMLITADAVRGKSTHDLIADFLADHEAGAASSSA